MKRYEEITVGLLQEGKISSLEAAAIAAVFEYAVLLFDQVAEAEEHFKKEFGEATYGLVRIMARGRRG